MQNYSAAEIRCIARRVFEEEMRKRDENSHCNICGSKYYNYGTSSSRQGFDWSAEEDQELRMEVAKAVKQIASNHRRSNGSIRSRIRQKFL